MHRSFLIVTTSQFRHGCTVPAISWKLFKSFACSSLLLVSLILFGWRHLLKHSHFLQFSRHETGVTHVLVTGGAGYIGSHATLRLLSDKYRVTIVDNLSRGNMGAVRVLQQLFPEPGRLQFIYADLGDAKAVSFL